MGAAAAVGAGVAVAGVAGSVISSNASKKAASQQAAAEQQAAQVQQQQNAINQANLSPFIQAGQAGLPLFSNFYKTSADQLGAAYSDAYNHIPQPMTMANLVNTPGYQFTLQQGQRSVANSNAAKGLGVSGSALQGAANYATGLADKTYLDQFGVQQQIYNDYLTQANLKQNQLATIYNQISTPVSVGENAAATSGYQGNTAAANVGNALAQAGVAQSAGTVGSANALAGGINSIAQGGLTYLGVQNALNQQPKNTAPQGAVGGQFSL